jgi:hypothetical protein
MSKGFTKEEQFLKHIASYCKKIGFRTRLNYQILDVYNHNNEKVFMIIIHNKQPQLLDQFWFTKPNVSERYMFEGELIKNEMDSRSKKLKLCNNIK